MERKTFRELLKLFPKLLNQSVKIFEYMQMSSDIFYYILHKIQLFLEEQ